MPGRDQPRPGAHGRPEAAGAGHRHHARHRRAGAGAAARPCAAPASVYRPRWGWDRRLAAAGGLVAWVIALRAHRHPGYIVTTRVAAAADPGQRHRLRQRLAPAAGALRRPRRLAAHRADAADEPGRRRRAAARRRRRPRARHPALRRRSWCRWPRCSRCSGRRSASPCSACARVNLDGAARIGRDAVACSAFGLLPLRDHDAAAARLLRDDRQPHARRFIQLFTVAVKIPLLLVCPLVLPPREVVLGLAAANGLSFVAGAVLGQVLLRRRLGRIGTAEVVPDRAHAVAASSARSPPRASSADRPVGRARPRSGGRGSSWWSRWWSGHRPSWRVLALRLLRVRELDPPVPTDRTASSTAAITAMNTLLK